MAARRNSMRAPALEADEGAARGRGAPFRGGRSPDAVENPWTPMSAAIGGGTSIASVTHAKKKQTSLVDKPPFAWIRHKKVSMPPWQTDDQTNQIHGTSAHAYDAKPPVTTDSCRPNDQRIGISHERLLAQPHGLKDKAGFNTENLKALGVAERYAREPELPKSIARFDEQQAKGRREGAVEQNVSLRPFNERGAVGNLIGGRPNRTLSPEVGWKERKRVDKPWSVGKSETQWALTADVLTAWFPSQASVEA